MVHRGAQWFSNGVLDLRSSGRRVEPHRKNFFVSLSKTHPLLRAFDCRSKGYWFQPHDRRGHYVVSLSKTPYPLLSAGSTSEDQSRHDRKFVDLDLVLTYLFVQYITNTKQHSNNNTKALYKGV